MIQYFKNLFKTKEELCEHNYKLIVFSPYRYDYYKYSKCTKCNSNTKHILISEQEYNDLDFEIRGLNNNDCPKCSGCIRNYICKNCTYNIVKFRKENENKRFYNKGD